MLHRNSLLMVVGDILPGLGPVVEVTKRLGWVRITFDQGTGYITFDVPAGLVIEVEHASVKSQVKPRKAASSVQTKSQFQQASPIPQPATTPPASDATASASGGSSGIGVPADPRPATSGPERPGNS